MIQFYSLTVGYSFGFTDVVAVRISWFSGVLWMTRSCYVGMSKLSYLKVYRSLSGQTEEHRNFLTKLSDKFTVTPYFYITFISPFTTLIPIRVFMEKKYLRLSFLKTYPRLSSKPQDSWRYENSKRFCLQNLATLFLSDWFKLKFEVF
jgi:hypothetical protein